MPEILPGDILVYEKDYRYVVAATTNETQWERAACGCCSDSKTVEKVWVWDDEPTEVLTPGGGIATVLPLMVAYDGWERVIRDGKEVTS